jgi:glycine betaine/proline transport system ATP-binding protein
MTERSVKFKCSRVWKLFGEGAGTFLEHYPSPTEQDIQREGLIAGVQDASFEIAEGEIFVIMGLSGSGKSTLLRCMSRLIMPTSGEINIDGVNLLDISERELIELRRHKMGMVFQHFALLPHLTVLGNVAFPLEIQNTSAEERNRRTLEMIELVGLKGRENYYPHELSGGQQQRVGIARSLAVNPEVWFLDEPFSALDPLIRREMQNELLRLQSLLRKTIVFITHDFDEAIRLADRIAIMKAGKVIQIGTPEELVLAPADDYVREFTSEIPRAKVLSVRTVMSKPGGDEVRGTDIFPHSSIESIAPEVISRDQAMAVLDDSGKVVGRLEPAHIIPVLAGIDNQVA